MAVVRRTRVYVLQVSFLLLHHADPSLGNLQGNTPLHRCGMRLRGMCVCVRDASNYRAAYLAYTDIAQLLLAKGVSVSIAARGIPCARVRRVRTTSP